MADKHDLLPKEEVLHVDLASEFPVLVPDQPSTWYLRLACPVKELDLPSLGLDLVLVVDRSETMNGEKMSLAANLVRLLINKGLDKQKDRIGLITFGTEATVRYDMGDITHYALQKALALLDPSCGMEGETNLGDALMQATQMCSVIPYEKGRQLAILVLTDGDANQGTLRDPDQLEAFLHTRYEQNDARVPIYFLGFGNDHRGEYLSRYARAGGVGQYFYVYDAYSLAMCCSRIIGRLRKIVLQHVWLSLETAKEAGPVAVQSIEPCSQYMEHSTLDNFYWLGNLAAGEERLYLIQLNFPRMDPWRWVQCAKDPLANRLLIKVHFHTLNGVHCVGRKVSTCVVWENKIQGMSDPRVAQLRQRLLVQKALEDPALTKENLLTLHDQIRSATIPDEQLCQYLTRQVERFAPGVISTANERQAEASQLAQSLGHSLAQPWSWTTSQVAMHGKLSCPEPEDVPPTKRFVDSQATNHSMHDPMDDEEMEYHLMPLGKTEVSPIKNNSLKRLLDLIDDNTDDPIGEVEIVRVTKRPRLGVKKQQQPEIIDLMDVENDSIDNDDV